MLPSLLWILAAASTCNGWKHVQMFQFGNKSCALLCCTGADANGEVDRREFSAMLDSLHAQAAKPSVTLRKSVHTSEWVQRAEVCARQDGSL